MNTNLQIPTALQPSSLQDQRPGNTPAQASALGLLPPNSNGLKARNNFSTLEKFEMKNEPKNNFKHMNKLGQEVLKDIAELEGMLK